MTTRSGLRPLFHSRTARMAALAVALLAGMAATRPAMAEPPPGDADMAAAGITARALPPGLVAARLRPGWTDAAGHRILALELDLEPGWKTYWRSPGDTGLPPRFDWHGSDNLGGVRLHWPAPQAIRSGDRLEMGYHDRLLLPITARPADPGQPVQIRVTVDLGLCRDICVPATLDLRAPAPDAGAVPDPAILRAMAALPLRLDHAPACRIEPIADGLRVTMALPPQGADLAAIDLAADPEAGGSEMGGSEMVGPGDGGPGDGGFLGGGSGAADRPTLERIWISGAQIVAGPSGPQAVVEMVGPEGRPFDLDPDLLRLTVIPAGGGRATEAAGCATP